jgi:hypothetical protein
MVPMVKPVFRVIADDAVAAPGQAEVRATLADIFPLLVHAQRFSHTWLRDLADDEIIISRDLADVLEAFRHLTEKRRA